MSRSFNMASLVRVHQPPKVVRVDESSPYVRRKCKIQSKLIRKKWREDKARSRYKKKYGTHIPPPAPQQQQQGAGVVLGPTAPLLTPQDLQMIAEHIKHQQTGGLKGSIREIEAGTKVPYNEAIRAPGHHAVFQHPTQMILAGSTKAGKTTLITQILKHREQMFDPNIRQIIWFYTMESSIEKPRKELPGAQFIQGEPTVEQLEGLDTSIPKVVVLDDLMGMTDKKSTFEDLKRLFTATSHHHNLSLVFIVQDMYVNKNMTRLANQAENIIMMCNGGSTYQTPMIATKLFGAGVKPFIEWSISDVRRHSSHGYLLFSKGAGVPEAYRVRSKILPSDIKNTFYIQKGTEKTEEYQDLKEDAQDKKEPDPDTQQPVHDQEEATS